MKALAIIILSSLMAGCTTHRAYHVRVCCPQAPVVFQIGVDKTTEVPFTVTAP